MKNKLRVYDIQTDNLVFMPQVPVVGMHEFMIEEVHGITVARLISPPND